MPSAGCAEAIDAGGEKPFDGIVCGGAKGEDCDAIATPFKPGGVGAVSELATMTLPIGPCPVGPCAGGMAIASC